MNDNALRQLENEALNPTDKLLADLKQVEGDLLLLGVGGKMGPDLAVQARRAFDALGKKNRVIGVSRFSSADAREMLESNGIETVAADLLQESQLAQLPQCPNVVFMAGTKFGTTGNEHQTWAMNAYLPGRVCETFRDSRIVLFSTGNVYPFVSIGSGGSLESDHPAPVGEYGQSCLGRERVFEHFSRRYSIPMLLFRLNYAIDFRYGILLEVANAVRNERPIDLTTGHVNVIWQPDANEIVLRSLLHCGTPPEIFNVTGPETVSVRWLAYRFGERFSKTPRFEGEEASTALLSNASRAHAAFGYPSVPLRRMIELVATWVEGGGETLDKPTHYQTRSGQF